MPRGYRWKQVRGKWQPVILEEDVVNEITRRLSWEYQIKMWRVRERIPGQGQLSEAGIPDLIGWIPQSNPIGNVWRSAGRFGTPLFIEVKRPGGAQRTAQIQFINEAKAGGCVAFFAESWGDVIRELNEQCGAQLKAA